MNSRLNSTWGRSPALQSKTIFNDRSCEIKMVRLRGGESLAGFQSWVPILLAVTEGSIEIELEEVAKKQHLRSGGSIRIEPMVLHGIRTATDSCFIVVRFDECHRLGKAH